MSRWIRAVRTFGKQVTPKRWQPGTIVGDWISAKTRKRVVSGPFCGMMYVDEAVGSYYYPKLLGTYEKELHALVGELSYRAFDQIVNIGAGEGYYAVGMARLNPRARVVAFETEQNGRRLIGAMAELNGVAKQVEVEETCDAKALGQLLKDGVKSLVVVDIEGGERDLLDTTEITGLRDATLVVEVHNAFKPHTDEILKERFKPTHTIREIRARQRTFADFPLSIPFPMSLLPKIYFEVQMGERPPGMSWLYLEPRG